MPRDGSTTARLGADLPLQPHRGATIRTRPSGTPIAQNAIGSAGPLATADVSVAPTKKTPTTRFREPQRVQRSACAAAHPFDFQQGAFGLARLHVCSRSKSTLHCKAMLQQTTLRCKVAGLPEGACRRCGIDRGGGGAAGRRRCGSGAAAAEPGRWARRRVRAASSSSTSARTSTTAPARSSARLRRPPRRRTASTRRAPANRRGGSSGCSRSCSRRGIKHVELYGYPGNPFPGTNPATPLNIAGLTRCARLATSTACASPAATAT